MMLPMILALAPAVAQAAVVVPAPIAAGVEDEIVITGFSKPFKLDGKQLATAVRVYRKYRPALAPRSRLLFQVERGGNSRRDLSGLKLTLRSGDTVVPLTLDARSRFVLPELGQRDWELRANRGAGSLRILPLILSPGGEQFDRRLGDMRLECEVTMAAIVKPTLSFVLRGLSSAVNVCRTKRVGMYLSLGNLRVASATATTGGTIRPLELSKNGREWRYPGYDKSLSDEARVRIRFE